jgi:transcriptional regulator with GAF, ATPase, and Fis domain
METIIKKIGREQLEILFQTASSLLLLDEGIAGACVRSGKVKLVSDTSKSHDFYPQIDRKTGFVTKSIIAAPLIIKNKTIGVIEVLNKRDNLTWGEEDKELLILIAFQSARVIQNARRHLQIQEHQALLKDEIDARYYRSRRSSHYARELNKPIKKISPEVMNQLLNYPWPGNVRELQNMIERAVVLATGNVININCLMLPSKKPEGLAYQEGLSEATEKFRLNYIKEIIKRCGGNQTEASKILMIQPTYLSRLLHKYRTTS